MDEKGILTRYLKSSHDALRWKLEGLDERDLRRPMTRTGTNLLGLVKHVAAVELGYFGDCMGRPHGVSLPWFEEDAEDNADMWATAEESTESVLALYDRGWEVVAATMEELPLDAPGEVPWWGNDTKVTLRLIAVHMLSELARHTGHADIVRELLDGRVGHRAAVSNLPERDEQWWADYVAKVQQAADDAAARRG